MSDETYRRGYGVDVRERALTPDESARVESELRAWTDHVRRDALRRAHEIVYALPIAVVVLWLAAGRGGNSAWIGAAMIVLLFAIIYIVARRHALKLAGKAQGPWHAPPGGFRVREARVVARSIVITAGDPEHARWFLFEVPDRWFFVDARSLPASSEARLARAEVRLTRLWPEGVYLDVSSSGDAIPTREVGERFTPDEDGADGFVDPASLPAKIRE